MVDITLKCQEKNICKKVHNFHHYLTWFLAPLIVLTPMRSLEMKWGVINMTLLNSLIIAKLTKHCWNAC